MRRIRRRRRIMRGRMIRIRRRGRRIIRRRMMRMTRIMIIIVKIT